MLIKKDNLIIYINTRAILLCASPGGHPVYRLNELNTVVTFSLRIKYKEAKFIV